MAQKRLNMTSVGNYTGPYISDGKFQTSVEWGSAPTLNPLDEASRRHDSAYAKWSDSRHRKAADQLFKIETEGMNGTLPTVAGNAVVYGNEAMKQAGSLASKVGTYGKFGPIGMLAGALAHEYEWLSDMNSRLNSRDYLAKERREVLDYYKTDPWLQKPIRQYDAVDGSVYEGQVTSSEVPTVRRAPQHGGDDFIPVNSGPKPSSGRVVPDHTELDSDGVPVWHRLPTGRWLRRKKKQKTSKVNPEIVAPKPVPRMAAWAERAVQQADDQKIAQAHYWPHRFDLTWNVNPLKMKRNKVVALSTKQKRAVAAEQNKPK